MQLLQNQTSPKAAIAGIFALVTFLCFFITRLLHKKRTNRDPPPPSAAGAWPITGHLHLLGGPDPAHITLGRMADEYGQIFSIKLGSHRAIVVSGSEFAKECFTTNDKAFSNRPKYLAAELLGYNYAMFGFSPYGPYWRQLRKIAILELLSNHTLENLRHVREAEVRASIKEAYERSNAQENVPIEMKSWFNALNFNLIFKMVVGKRFVGTVTSEDDKDQNDRCRIALRSFFELAGRFVLSDVFPLLRWFDIGGYVKAMKRTAKELDDVVGGWLDEHKRRRACGEVEGDRDFMDVMLSLLHNADQLPSYDADTVNKATCLALISGGTDTTAVTLTWALSLLLNNRHVLKQAQLELESHIGRERQVTESDIKNLVYLQAIVKETLRLYPAAPLSVPHESAEDCTIGGYHVPAGTRLLLNISKLHRDPRAWPDPLEFRPERFLTTHKDLDVRGQNFEYLPFGSGRRMCPGVTFALQVLHIALATLLHSFDIETAMDGPVDMRAGMGITSPKVTPLEVILTPRLPLHLYV
ncbi:cytochrome P450 CYP82D47-like [Rhodamnia argentea]|uniref:Cytochrome P450 CYP82D47-like n=1 Tax=Rhodamnia argentea TaxID=178133 RepID=A0A8B8MRR6_9MYRT|nr:cytochrome P450 CYP82D47-like [Rhodamnia argentea]